MKELRLQRFNSNDKQTLGVLSLVEDDKILFSCYTLELPWLGNEKNKSCIPTGHYKINKRKSKKFGEHLHILNVPERDYILIHPGNFHTQIRGCVLVGDGLTDINSDGYVDVVNSRKTLNKLMSMIDEYPISLSIYHFLK